MILWKVLPNAILLLVALKAGAGVLPIGVPLAAGFGLPFAEAFSNARTPARFIRGIGMGSTSRKCFKPVVVVGKIIIDEYGDPFPLVSGEGSGGNDEDDESAASGKSPPAPPKTVSIGGGGPQAAFGASAALAVFDKYYNKSNNNKGGDEQNNNSRLGVPPVVFVAPVGKDWTDSETAALTSCLGAPSTPVVVHDNTVDAEMLSHNPHVLDIAPGHPPIETHLVRKKSQKSDDDDDDNDDDDDDGFFTPRIRLWHDDDQAIHWYALNDSFGPRGADGLWRKNPSAEDLASLMKGRNSDEDNDESVVLHVVAEAWTGAAGGRLDFLPLVRDENLLSNHLSFVGIEPVASGKTVTREDAEVAAGVLEECFEAIRGTPQSLVDDVFWCPDRGLGEAIIAAANDMLPRSSSSKDEKEDKIIKEEDRREDDPVLTIATRDGPRGSVVETNANEIVCDDCFRPPTKPSTTRVPAATLRTDDGSPVDPTGAGNAYSGAMTALLGNGVDPIQSACIASGVGATVCEHEGLPSPSRWASTLERIFAAAKEVEAEMAAAR